MKLWNKKNDKETRRLPMGRKASALLPLMRRWC